MKRYGKTELARLWILHHMGRMKSGDKMMIVHPNADHTIITRNGDQFEEKKDDVKKPTIKMLGLNQGDIRENHNQMSEKASGNH